MPKRTSISLVIPVYNEEAYLGDCLRAALAQSLPFDEIIVVDNNSTDGAVAIAAQFPGVRLIREPRQGVVYARDRGFDAARGDVIARIDADTRLAPDWAQQLLATFADPSVGAATGLVHYSDMRLARFIDWVDRFWRRRITRLLRPEMPLQGANMAVRARAWRKVRAHACRKRGLHEDFDLAIHLAACGERVVYDEALAATLGLRCCQAKFASYCRYWLFCPRTYAYHGLKSRRHMYPIITLLIMAYPVLKLLHKAPVGQLLPLAAAVRVNPAAYVD
ncbi:MAG TPA: glycosyltransferase family 2 protein [Candidatus Saccharimonadales bacterium]